MEIPNEIKEIGLELNKANFEAYLVGGCVRDLLLMEVPRYDSGHSVPREYSGPSVPREYSGPRDWDITTNARPEEIQKIFPENVYENSFGTVGVKTGSENPALKIVEVTTYRLEGRYTDKRHPDEIKFAKTIEDDLSRRDFTVNAMALKLTSDRKQLTIDKGLSDEGQWSLPAQAGNVNGQMSLIDPFDGKKDLKAGVIRAVGNPEERFNEDALRIMRAVRFMAQLNFEIEKETENAIRKSAGLLEFISKERIRDEFIKLLMADGAVNGIKKMSKLGIMKYVVPELEAGVGVGQNRHHIYTVFEHNVRSFEYAVKQKFPLHLRVAALFHDIGKPKSKRGEGEFSTFYGHQVVGVRMATQILDRLRFPKEMTEKIALLIREHMFVYDPDTVTDAGARRLLRRVGPENIEDLFQLREADRIGSGVPKAQPYRLRHLKFRIEKVSSDPISAKMLKINGNDIMRDLHIEPGRKIGYILAILLEEALDDPKINNREYLVGKVKQLYSMSERQLEEMAKFARKSADEAQTQIEEDIKKKYSVD